MKGSMVILSRFKLALWAQLLGSLLSGCGNAGKASGPAGIPEANIMLDSSLLGIYTIANGLSVPWEICWGPDDRIWYTEQSGTVSRLDPVTGEKELLLKIPEVWFHRSAGLLGMAVGRLKDGAVYAFVDYTTRRDSVISSRLVRYRLQGDTLVDPFLLLEIPGNTGHNGSRVVLSADEFLYWATGDAARSANAQDTGSLNGKILKIGANGTLPVDNTLPGSPVWAWGFRNMQGLVFSPSGKLYSSEHGDATDDEVNLLEPGNNYGWPKIEGYADKPGEQIEELSSTRPLKAWTPTIAPAGIDFYAATLIPEWTNSLVLGSLKAQSLRILTLSASGREITAEHIFLEKALGRIRDICISPAGEIFLSTSNRDWNPAPGFPLAEDDRIIRIAPTVIKTAKVHSAKIEKAETAADPQSLYSQYCASCHKPDGRGVAGSFPPLAGSPLVNGDRIRLAKYLLNGKGQMPAFGFLKNEELAMISTYIRTSWGNTSTALEAEEITSIRKN